MDKATVRKISILFVKTWKQFKQILEANWFVKSQVMYYTLHTVYQVTFLKIKWFDLNSVILYISTQYTVLVALIIV